jgi:hypothetical protein
MTGAQLGAWDPLTPAEVADVFANCPVLWWIAGGYAIDALVGRNDRRPHDDIDVGLLRREQIAGRSILSAWDLHCAQPPGRLRPWRAGELLEEPVHDIWARTRAGGPWRFQLVLNAAEDDEWVYRRDPRIRRSLAELVWHVAGIPYLVPEVQLLFKAKSPRPKDQRDFEESLHLLDSTRRRWLAEALNTSAPGHPWTRLL